MTFDDIYRQMGINLPQQPSGQPMGNSQGGPGTQPTSQAQFGPTPQGIYNNNESSLFNLLRGNMTSMGEAFGTGNRWNPEQYTDQAQRLQAWNALGNPTRDYQGRPVTAQDAGGNMTWNGQILGNQRNSFGQALGMSGGQNMGYQQQPSTGMGMQQLTPQQQYGVGQQGYTGSGTPQGFGQGGQTRGQSTGFDFSNPMNYSGYGNWNQPRPGSKGTGR